MTTFRLPVTLADAAVVNPRFSVLGRLGTDVSSIATWDPELPRLTRILVPVDVQAFVANADRPEDVVAVLARSGDPAPFADGAPLPAGVHLHWALPDALLRVTDRRSDRRDGSEQPGHEPAYTPLPDLWVVVRTLQPRSQRQVHVKGWVVDARTSQVTDLRAFTGPAAAPAAADPVTVGTLGPLGLATYRAAADRFALHDPLDDLDEVRAAVGELDGDQAVYTVAGWWQEAGQDPLASALGTDGLDATLEELGWHVRHGHEDEDVAQPDRRDVRTMARYSRTDAAVPAAQVFDAAGRPVSERLHGIELPASGALPAARTFWIGGRLPRYHTLLHGSVLGVPVGADLPAADDRPAADGLSFALGADVDDVVAAFAAAGLGFDEADRAAAEDVMAAFSAGTVTLLGTPDGLDDLAQREHDSGFWAAAGKPVPGATPDRLREADATYGPNDVGRKARAGSGRDRILDEVSGIRLAWDLGRFAAVTAGQKAAGESGDALQARPRLGETPATGATATERRVERAAPRCFRPLPPLLAVQGARPSHRHHGDGLFEQDDSGRSRLQCRYPHSAVPSWEGVLDGATVLPSLGSGAIPAEVLTVTREAVLLNGYGRDWLARAGSVDGKFAEAVAARLDGEMARLYGHDGVYDGRVRLPGPVPKAAVDPAEAAWAEVRAAASPPARQLAVELSRLSALKGLPPSPVALTTWRQPWVPLWLEWQVTLAGSRSLRGWQLGPVDLDRAAEPAPADAVTLTLTGRSPASEGVGDSLRAAISQWLAGEGSRLISSGVDAYGSQAVNQELAGLDHPLDLVSASLDGIREQLLGIEYVGQVGRDPVSGKPRAPGDPVPLFGGTLRLDRVRLVDAFGRTLTATDPTLDALQSTTELAVTGQVRTIWLRPRLQHDSRWLFRLLDAAQPPGTPTAGLREAWVDQVDPAAAANPVAGFLLPDHIDESLEAFTVAGSPIGEVGHEAVKGAVTWEPAPGRPIRSDAGPLVGIAPQDRLVAEVAAGLVRVDAAARDSGWTGDSALTCLLRAIDTTLWSVDSLAAVGSASVAGLVGRPLAVVRASLTLDAPDDSEDVAVTAPGGAAARKAAFAALADEQVPVRLGSLSRTDDALIGFFVDDDYEHLHLVDRAVASQARRSGRNTGQLGVLGSPDQKGAPAHDPLDHPLLVTDDTLLLRPGQTVLLTLLMLPMGRVHLTSGLLPRKELTLADSWTTGGLRRLVPSVRVGPLLVDPDEIRLPLVQLLGDKQTFTRRTGEITWRDDPIVAATQTAYLPRAPHEVQEGWIRVTPEPEGGTP